MTTQIIYFYFGWLEPANSVVGLQMVFIAQMGEEAKDFGYESVLMSSTSPGRSFVIDSMRRRSDESILALVVECESKK